MRSLAGETCAMIITTSKKVEPTIIVLPCFQSGRQTAQENSGEAELCFPQEPTVQSVPVSASAQSVPTSASAHSVPAFALAYMSEMVQCKVPSAGLFITSLPVSWGRPL